MADITNNDILDALNITMSNSADISAYGYEYNSPIQGLLARIRELEEENNKLKNLLDKLIINPL